MCYNELLHYKPIMEECIITPCREKRLGVRVYFLTISAMTPSRSINNFTFDFTCIPCIVFVYVMRKLSSFYSSSGAHYKFFVFDMV